MLHTIHTKLAFTVSESVDAAQHEATMKVRYTVTPGAEATREEPGYGASVSVYSVSVLTDVGTTLSREDDAPDWLWPFVERDEDLQAEMLAHAEAMDEYARDQAADARRDERVLEHG